MSDSIYTNAYVRPYLIPVTDSDTQSYQIPAALYDLAPPAQLRLAGPPADLQSGSSKVRPQLLDLGVALRLGYGDLFTANLALQATTWMFEVSYYSSVPGAAASSGLIVTEYWGFGARLIASFYNLKAATSLDIGALSAQADVNAVKSSYFIEVFGIPLPLQQDLGMVFTTNFGNFDQTANGLIGCLTGMVSEVLKDPAKLGQIKPALLCVDLDLSQIPVDENDIAAYCFALQQVKNGKTLAQALQAIPSPDTLPPNVTVTSNAVSAYYAALGVSTGSAPGAPQKTAASQLLLASGHGF